MVMEAERDLCRIGESSGSMTTHYVCWSRMQAEAGQALHAIVRRKELERRAGGGMFCWGVGNAPAAIISALAKLREPVAAVFSIMKSRPKVVDLRPKRIVAWRRYLEIDGSFRLLPRHILVTSRAESASGPKSKHFALMCWSDRPLTIQHGEPFDPAAYRNAGGTGAPVGASQVTALLRRTSLVQGTTQYEVNLRASLVGAYWVRLADPVDCSSEFDHVDKIVNGSDQEWLEFVDRAKGAGEHRERHDSPQRLLL